MDIEKFNEIQQYGLSRLFVELVNDSPVLSGNMQSMIQYNGINVVIEAPFYDMKKWEKSGEIVHTGKSIKGYTDYAEWVNEAGGFSRHNKSEHWANRVVNRVCRDIAKKYGGRVRGRLPE